MAAAGRICCLYHYPCHDGIFAALAVHLHHTVRLGQAVEYFPNTTYAPRRVQELGLLGDELVYLADFSGPPGFAISLAAAARQVVVLDHHKTAAEELAGPAVTATPNLEVHFDMERSGATVARDFFGLAPHLSRNFPAQAQLFAHIEDIDLWRWRLPGSRAFLAGLRAAGLEYSAVINPAIFDQLQALTPEGLVAAGAPLLAEEAARVAAAVAGAFPVQLGGAVGAAAGWGRGLAVLAGPKDPGLADIRSQVGHALADAAAAEGLLGVGVVAYTEDGMANPSLLKLSLRSVGAEDTTVVARAHGGGGHASASSLLLPAAEFEGWRLAP